MNRLRWLARACLATLLLPVATNAQDLLTTWRAALMHDGGLAVARAEHDVSQTLADQADALWRPQLRMSVAAGVGANETAMRAARFAAPAMGAQDIDDARFSTSIAPGLTTEVALQARQPLFDPARKAQQEQLRLGASIGNVSWQAAQTELALATAQNYFQLALAQTRLDIRHRQVQALRTARDEAQDRYRIGDLPITDAHEADAALAIAQAQLADAGLQRDTARRQVADSTGLIQPVAQLPGDTLPAVPPWPYWKDAIAQRNPQLKLMRNAVRVAEQTVREQSATGKPSLDLVAQAAHQRLAGHGSYGSRARNHEKSAMLGVQLHIPISTGGMTQARKREATHRLVKAQAELDLTQQTVERQGHDAWQMLKVGAARIAALRENRSASQARLNATRLGYEVGDRTTLDVLNAENAAAQAELELAQARVDWVVGRLQLAALADELDEQFMTKINANLMPAAQAHEREAGSWKTWEQATWQSETS